MKIISKFILFAIVALLFSIGFTKHSWAQLVSDSLQLEQIEVVATRIRQPLKLQPTHINFIDSARLSFVQNKTLGEVLSMESTLFIKSNGPGLVATASQRGFGAEQIQVLWEGIPLNNSMLGLTDLSLLPADFFSNIQISSGTPSSAFGGGISGVIMLQSNDQAKSYVSLSQSVGSFGQYNTGAQASVSQGGWNVSLHTQYADAENDYRYFNPATEQIERRGHNHQEQLNVMTSVGYKEDGDRFETTLWYSDSNSQIPGKITSAGSRTRQEDQSMRWLTQYESWYRGLHITAKSYLDQTELNYYDPANSTQSQSTIRRWLGTATLGYALSDQLLLKGVVSLGITGAESNNYNGLKVRRQLGVLLNPQVTLMEGDLHLYPALRLDVYNDFGSVLSPSLGINYNIYQEKIYVRGQLSRNFNPPAFNALYWPRVGDPNLKPERSNSAEVGLTGRFGKGLFHQIDITGFYTHLKNGIRWYPNGKGTFAPSNIQEIVSKGIEVSMESTFNLGRGFQFRLNQAAALIDTEVAEPRFEGDVGVGNQMRYIPKWKYKASLSLQKDFLTALLHYRWVGRRFITETESKAYSLDPYQRVDVVFQAQKEWLGLAFTGNIRVNNLLDARYAIIKWYAMPLRNVQCTLTATYNF